MNYLLIPSLKYAHTRRDVVKAKRTKINSVGRIENHTLIAVIIPDGYIGVKLLQTVFPTGLDKYVGIYIHGG